MPERLAEGTLRPAPLVLGLLAYAAVAAVLHVETGDAHAEQGWPLVVGIVIMLAAFGLDKWDGVAVIGGNESD